MRSGVPAYHNPWCLNRTKIGLKYLVYYFILVHSSCLNRTKIGLKSARFARSEASPSGLNRTKIGLKSSHI